jgi:hypothetical protein
MRVARSLVGRLPLGALLLPLQFLGFVFLLLFFRKLADVLARHDLRRLVDWIFAMAIGGFLVFGLLAAEAFLDVGMLRMLPRPAGIVLLALPLVLFAATMASYIVLLRRMASAAATFARFLAATEQSGEIQQMWRLAEETE